MLLHNVVNFMGKCWMIKLTCICFGSRDSMYAKGQFSPFIYACGALLLCCCFCSKHAFSYRLNQGLMFC
jgi:hypothetical protein